MPLAILANNFAEVNQDNKLKSKIAKAIRREKKLAKRRLSNDYKYLLY
jgi:hypothetical protein